VISDTLTRKGKRSVRRHLFLTSIRTTPEALLRLIRQRWSIENEWHWARDAQLGEDAHRYANPGPIKGPSQTAFRLVPDWDFLEAYRS